MRSVAILSFLLTWLSGSVVSGGGAIPAGCIGTDASSCPPDATNVCGSAVCVSNKCTYTVPKSAGATCVNAPPAGGSCFNGFQCNGLGVDKISCLVSHDSFCLIVRSVLRSHLKISVLWISAKTPARLK